MYFILKKDNFCLCQCRWLNIHKMTKYKISLIVALLLIVVWPKLWVPVPIIKFLKPLFKCFRFSVDFLTISAATNRDLIVIYTYMYSYTFVYWIFSNHYSSRRRYHYKLTAIGKLSSRFMFIFIHLHVK